MTPPTVFDQFPNRYNLQFAIQSLLKSVGVGVIFSMTLG